MDQLSSGLVLFLLSLSPWRLDIFCGIDIAGNYAMLTFKPFDIIPYQAEYVAVDGPSLIISNISELLQHCIFNSDGNTFYCHNNRLF